MTASVRVECRGRLGRIELHRPDALNALNAAMVRRIADQLAAWRHDDAVGTVLLAGAGDRAFCAGGDIVSIYHDARRGGTASVDFWRAEYALDAAIARYPKPVVALLHPPFTVTPAPDEVAEVFDYPLARLLDPAQPERRNRLVEGRERTFWVWPHERHLVWGATAAILRNLALLLRG